MTEVISLGTLRAWIDATSESDIKANVARSLAMPSAQVLNGVLHSLNLIRNISAHHCRLWNRLLVKRLPTKKLYNYLVVMAIMIRKVAPQSTWASRLAGIVSTMTIKQQGEMGFPAEWESRELWS
jgi:abortive infection bacteriophage resistance protein